MPVVKSRVVLEIARGVSAFLHLDAGLTRGEAPAPESELRNAQSKLTEQSRRIQRLQKRLDSGDQKARQSGPAPEGEHEQAVEPPKKAEVTDQRAADWHRRKVGNLWEEVGKLQFDFLRDKGLEPQHRFLDIGCGSLRGGLRFIPYLEPGHYYGIDQSQELMDAGVGELGQESFQRQRPTLVQMEDFGFERLGETFDYALAQSVFTHLPLNVIARCLVNVERVLESGGVFFATFFENPGGKHSLEPVEQGDGVISHYDRDPFHYTVEAFEWVCDGLDLEVEYIGDWGHPRNQYMLAFHRV